MRLRALILVFLLAPCLVAADDTAKPISPEEAAKQVNEKVARNKIVRTADAAAPYAADPGCTRPVSPIDNPLCCPCVTPWPGTPCGARPGSWGSPCANLPCPRTPAKGSRGTSAPAGSPRCARSPGP